MFALSLPEHLNLLRCVTLTLRLTGLHSSDRLRFVMEGEVWAQWKELLHLSRAFGCRCGGLVLVRWFTKRVFQSLCPESGKGDENKGLWVKCALH